MVRLMSIGPKDLTTPTGPPVIIWSTSCGSKITRQDFDDGSIFQAEVPAYEPLTGLAEVNDIVPFFRTGRWISVHAEDGMLYLTVWVPTYEALEARISAPLAAA